MDILILSHADSETVASEKRKPPRASDDDLDSRTGVPDRRYLGVKGPRRVHLVGCAEQSARRPFAGSTPYTALIAQLTPGANIHLHILQSLGDLKILKTHNHEQLRRRRDADISNWVEERWGS
jgi:hypothetical protein